MKRKGKIWFFVVAILIVVLAYTTVAGVTTRYGDTITPVVRGVEDIRFGIDIRGGVEATFVPADGSNATAAQMDGAQTVIENRLIALGVTDYEIYKDLDRSRLIVRFPWQAEETDFNPETAIQELSATYYLTFRNGTETDEEGNPTGEVILTGSDVASAAASYGQISSSTYEHYVQLTLNETGAQKFSEATTQLATTGGTVSIWMDNEMISAPTVNEPIIGGVATISGSFDAESAKALADNINSGALPFALSVESYSTISPTLGSQSLEAMVIAGLIALALVILFMIINYRLVGFVASIALVGQVAATLALISRYFVVFPSFTLTLPGIAGIILTIGMSVDANVINGERIKEELRGGKKLDAAIRAGFQRGMTPIIDGNITVLIVAAILMGAFGPSDGFFAYLFKPIFFAFGASTAGTIYAFGYTLMVGVALNFVFGLFSTRAMLTSLSKFKFLRNPVLYGGLSKGKEPKEPKRFDFFKNRKKYFSISGAIIVIIVLFSFIFGVRLDVQFSGGAIISYSYSGEVDMTAVQTLATETLGEEVSIQQGENAAVGNTVTITLPGNRTLEVEELEALSNAMVESFPENEIEQIEVNNVTPTIGKEFLLKSIVAVVAASLLILIFIAFRFRRIGGWRGGLSAVVALLHDLVIIFGVFVLLRIPLNSNFIAALLTILGYSINDTVVIYDRVRENRGLYGKKLTFAENVNLSINQSLRRSLNTTLTTLMALTCVCVLAVIYGLDSIFTFVFPLMIGMMSGVYSSVCIAGPLWVLWENRKQSKSKITAQKSSSTASKKISGGKATASKKADVKDKKSDEDKGDKKDVKPSDKAKSEKKKLEDKKEVKEKEEEEEEEEDKKDTADKTEVEEKSSKEKTKAKSEKKPDSEEKEEPAEETEEDEIELEVSEDEEKDDEE